MESFGARTGEPLYDQVRTVVLVGAVLRADLKLDTLVQRIIGASNQKTEDPLVTIQLDVVGGQCSPRVVRRMDEMCAGRSKWIGKTAPVIAAEANRCDRVGRCERCHHRRLVRKGGPRLRPAPQAIFEIEIRFNYLDR